MNKILIELENCYGISKMTHEFDFNKLSTHTVYAPNGMMKTSLAKTFIDLSKGEESHDSIFRDRITKRSIRNEDLTELDPNQVFVVLPYAQDFKSAKLSTLLVNKELKEKYEEIHANIDEKKEILLKELKQYSGIKNGLEETISIDFTHTPKNFFKSIQRVKAEVLDKTEPEFSNIKYQSIFNDKTLAFLETKDFKTKLKDYIDKYNELIESSTYFRKGIFNHNNAATIAKNLKDNGFFKANHSVSLNAEGASRKINTEAELEEVIQQEKDSILNNPELISAFEEIDKKITANRDLRAFRNYIEENPTILPEFANISAFKQKIWISYFKENSEAYRMLEREYGEGQKEIEAIELQAKKEKTQWIDVIDEFNKRFFVPFKLSVDNQEDVILKSELPIIKFTFHDSKDDTVIEESELLKVLSNGELRALYLLNIIFEVEARKSSNQETLFVIDDIADSFDYKNKYAIIEYLKDISRVDFFNQILLTHNFDFYRTVSSRLNIVRENRLNTIKTNNEIKLIEEVYQNNPFNHWKNNFHIAGNESMLIASIPFVRNLAEYSGAINDFKKLTSILHIKEDTHSITIDNLKTIFKSVLVDKNNLELANPATTVLDLIFKKAEEISKIDDIAIELENKIVLAIAIRLKAEQFMIKKINNDEFWKSIEQNQTMELYQKYLEQFGDDIDEVKLLEDVNLMTPENIHLNSFMYEPILDMSCEHLKQLFKDVSQLS